MTDHAHIDETPQLSAAAQREWGEHVESVLKGLAHALNNRAAALSGMLGISRYSDLDNSAADAILGAELERVQELVMAVRSIGAPEGGPETFAPADAATEALAILALHADQRERTVTIDATSAAPTRVPRWMFVRSLVALAASASNGASDRKSPVRLSIAASGDWLIVHADRSPSVRASYLTTELVGAMGGELLPNQLGFRVPTLAAIRQREGR